jgi:putative ABC transport system permease protein
VAAALAIGVAAVLPTVLLRLAGEDVPPYLQRRLVPDGQVLVFSLAVATLACLFFGLAPAFRATRGTIPIGAIDRGSTRATRVPLRTVFLATQVAVCTVLLIGAGLLTRAVNYAMTFDPGFAVDGVRITSVSLPPDSYNRAQQTAFITQVREQLERDYPGGIALATPTPLQMRLGMTIRLPNERTDRHVMTTAVSPSYFDVLNIPVVQGQVFDRKSTTEAVVNQALAALLWPGQNPLGQIVHDVERDTVSRTFTVVGVVRNAYLTRLDSVEPMIFTPAARGQLITRGNTEAVERIRAVALGINQAAVIRTSPVTDNFRRQLEESRMGATLAWGIGLLGLTLAAVGVFGVFAYAAEERRREIGLRLALGATRSQIIRLLVRTSGRALFFGLAAGVLASFGAEPVLDQYLYGMNPLDPRAYGSVAGLLIVAGSLATFIPARRACKVDPAVTLREE